MHTDDNLLDRGFRVLDEVAAPGGARRFNELLRATGINRATLAKILRTLRARGMLEKTADAYRIGLKAADYARGHPPRPTFTERYGNALSDLAERFEVTALLLSVTERYSVCLDKRVHENAPAMLSVGSVVEASRIHPWAMARAMAHGQDLPALARDVRRDARSTSYVRKPPTAGALQELWATLPPECGDDGGWMVPNVRRVAARLPEGPGGGADGFLAAGFVAGASVDRRALLEAMRDAGASMR